MAGYPGHPLPKKLGIKAGHRVCLLNAPGPFQRSLAADDVRIAYDLRHPLNDVVVLFVESLEELEDRLTHVLDKLHPAGGLWVAWRSSSRRISVDILRRIALAAGMTVSKTRVIATSYEGVRLVLRTEIREAIAYRAEPPPRSTIATRTRRSSARIAPRVARSSSGGSSMRRARARSAK